MFAMGQSRAPCYCWANVTDQAQPMLSLSFRTFEFLVYHLLIVIVDRVSRLPQGSNPPEIMRLYRENLALKTQNGALLLELDAARQAREDAAARPGGPGVRLPAHTGR